MSTLIWPTRVATTAAEDNYAAPRNAGMRTRRLIGVLCVVGYFCSTFIESITSTVNGDASPAQQLAHIEANLGQIRTQVLFEFLSPLFLIAFLLMLVGAIRGRGVWLASAAGVFGVLGSLAQTVGAATHLVALVLITSGAPAASIENVLTAELPDAVFFLFFAAPLALILLAAAAWRARATTWIPFAAVIVYVALDFSLVLPEAVPLAIGMIAFVAISWPFVTGKRA